jgi:acyl-coenzyme A thioesterase PaaI-like protein
MPSLTVAVRRSLRRFLSAPILLSLATFVIVEPALAAKRAIQDLYPDEFSHCYGCGRLNQDGLQVRTYWDGQQSRATFQPRPYHTAIPGIVYGGLIASLVDCHSTGTGAAAWAQEHGVDLEREGAPRFVTASLQVDYLRPTPLGPTLELIGRVQEVKGRKVIVEVDVMAEGKVCARGRAVVVKIDEDFGRPAPTRGADPPAQPRGAGSGAGPSGFA